MRLEEKNGVAPRATELVEDGILGEADSVVCPKTKKTVRRLKIIAPFSRYRSVTPQKSKKDKPQVASPPAPTKPGYYWFGTRPVDRFRIVEVVALPSGLRVKGLGIPLESMRGFWSEKLKQPKYPK